MARRLTYQAAAQLVRLDQTGRPARQAQPALRALVQRARQDHKVQAVRLELPVRRERQGLLVQLDHKVQAVRRVLQAPQGRQAQPGRLVRRAQLA